MNWIIGVIVALVLCVGVQTYRLNSAQTAHAEYVASVTDQHDKAETKARETEQRHQSEINKVQSDATAQKLLDDANAAQLVAVGDSLREQTSKLLANRAALSARLAERGKTINDLTDLLAQLRAEADDYAGQLATALDASRRSGFACERAYSAIAH